MKRIMLLSTKMLLAALFLYNIGLLSLFSLLSNIEETPYPPIKADGGKSDFQYLQEKVKHAQTMGAAYGPEEYFSDLTDIRLKEKKNDFDRAAILSVQPSITKLLEVFDRNIKQAHRNLSDADYKILMSKLSSARTKSQEIINPGSSQRELEANNNLHSSEFWSEILFSLLAWLASFYLKNLPLALALLWTWWYQEKETLKVNNPISFLICLLLYPLVIGRVWQQIIHERTRLFAMKIEFKKRQISLFSIISADEIAAMHHLAKTKLGLKNYKQELDARGLIIRHALVPALLATIMITIMPIYANGSITKVTVEQSISVSPPGISNYHLKIDHNLNNSTWSIPILTEELIVKIPYFSVINRVIALIPNLLKGYKRQLEPIPILITNLQNTEQKNPNINNQKS